jgi:hypothetical protein
MVVAVVSRSRLCASNSERSRASWCGTVTCRWCRPRIQSPAYSAADTHASRPPTRAARTIRSSRSGRQYQPWRTRRTRPLCTAQLSCPREAPRSYNSWVAASPPRAAICCVRLTMVRWSCPRAGHRRDVVEPVDNVCAACQVQEMVESGAMVWAEIRGCRKSSPAFGRCRTRSRAVRAR